MAELHHERRGFLVDQSTVTAGQVQQQDADHGYMMPQVPAGVTVPLELARPLAAVAVLGLADYARRNGGPAVVAPRLQELITALAASASACATPLARVGPRQLTTAQAALVMGVSPQRVRQLAAGKRIIASKTGRDWLVDAQAAEDYGRHRGHVSDGDRRGEGHGASRS